MNKHYNHELEATTIDIARQVVSAINAAGKIIGIVATNVSDVLFGGVMLGLLFKDIDLLFGPPIDGWLAGFTLSFAFWFIQLLMWQMVFDDGIITWGDMIPLTLAIVVAIADTNIDIAPVFVWVDAASISDTLREIPLFGGYTLYNVTITSLSIGFYIVNGCSELFNAWYFNKHRSTKNPARSNANKKLQELKNARKQTYQTRRQQQHNQQYTYRPVEYEHRQ